MGDADKADWSATITSILFFAFAIGGGFLIARLFWAPPSPHLQLIEFATPLALNLSQNQVTANWGFGFSLLKRDKLFFSDTNIYAFQENQYLGGISVAPFASSTGFRARFEPLTAYLSNRTSLGQAGDLIRTSVNLIVAMQAQVKYDGHMCSRIGQMKGFCKDIDIEVVVSSPNSTRTELDLGLINCRAVFMWKSPFYKHNSVCTTKLVYTLLVYIPIFIVLLVLSCVCTHKAARIIRKPGTAESV